ncbi:Glycosyltransferase, catalytic subunit of cellulose synthase and poly-beta-1,6-N-acetylglucosamine synthase [Lishizhenia tianjinensis]|uniref:Glycosyltransferase, catalytic subunit of cellulose synthase and poly-beta-1,6-N-acetylglucosamine synthase n=1 Tax=Lishizhenia tianjinensis TaxID=477690 RepID=A0A1I7A3A7_9FLAO|nr:glycosyltransferase [Lishizhenia tianjinensis]SFT69406.1 Glycosyltransferase, catalytic subunit of cellulose synthase and poly-beta-1,6-N-acetylglucosamine synthase [Lishizhenia tianjinensis]
MTLLFYSIPLLFLLLYLGLYVFVISKREKVIENGKRIDLKDLTLIVPFRNEASNIDRIIHALHTQEKQPYEIIFVDDHSTDNTLSVLKNELIDSPLNVKLLHLEKDYGKKAAIRLALDHTETNYVLQWDADVVPGQNYFNNIQELFVRDMWVLPVVLRTTKGLLKYFQWDYLFIHALSYRMRKLKVLTASGANLLYNRKTYLNLLSKASGEEYLSGDDYFMLAVFQEHNKMIGVSAASSLAVETTLPTSLKLCLQQRLRWLSKSSWYELVGILLLAAINLYFLILILSFTTYGLGLFLLKTLIDIAYLREYTKAISKKDIYAVPLFFLILPFYFFVLFLASFILKKEWKGRELKKK